MRLGVRCAVDDPAFRRPLTRSASLAAYVARPSAFAKAMAGQAGCSTPENTSGVFAPLSLWRRKVAYVRLRARGLPARNKRLRAADVFGNFNYRKQPRVTHTSPRPRFSRSSAYAPLSRRSPQGEDGSHFIFHLSSFIFHLSYFISHHLSKFSCKFDRLDVH